MRLLMPHQPPARSAWRDTTAALLLGTWLLWPWFAIVGALTSARFWGEDPTPSEQLEGAVYLGAALACGFGAPLIARWVAPYRRTVRVLAAAEVAIVSILLLVAFLT